MLRLDPRPPLISSSFRSLDPNRFDKIRLYIRRSNSNKFSSNGGVTQGDKSNSTSSEEHGYRYELRIVDRKISDEATALQICIPCAVLLIPGER